MSRIAEMEHNGVYAHLWRWDHDDRLTIDVGFHATNRDTEIEVRHPEGEEYIVIHRSHEGGRSTDFLSLGQARDLQEQLGQALVEAIAEKVPHEVPA